MREQILSGRPLKVRGIAACSTQGWGKPTEERDPIAAPAEWRDDTAFWAIATGSSMRPEGIPGGALCLISPAADPAPGDRVWIREARSNATSIKRLVSMRDDGWIELLGWMPPVDGKQQSFNESRKLSAIDELFVVKGVWRGRPGGPHGVEFIPDPRAIVPQAEPEVEMSSVSLMAAELSGGAGAVADDIALDHISFPTRWFRQQNVNPDRATLHRVRGKSMEPTIREGSIVLLDHDRTDPSQEGIYAFNRGEDGLRVKRLHRVRDHLIVMSDNRSEEYPTELLAREELNEIRILGRVAAVIAEI
jgi:phage repressor protein C with HTH and peptisase S24 domain